MLMPVFVSDRACRFAPMPQEGCHNNPMIRLFSMR